MQQRSLHFSPLGFKRVSLSPFLLFTLHIVFLPLAGSTLLLAWGKLILCLHYYPKLAGISTALPWPTAEYELPVRSDAACTPSVRASSDGRPIFLRYSALTLSVIPVDTGQLILLRIGHSNFQYVIKSQSTICGVRVCFRVTLS